MIVSPIGESIFGYNLQERTLEEHKKLVEGIMKRDKKRRKKIEEAGIDYECPDIVRSDCFSFTWIF